MKIYTKEKIGLTTRQILLYLVDAVVKGHDVFDSYGYYRKSTNDYFRWRDFDKRKFQKNLYRLKKDKIVDIYIRGQKRIIELTKKGKKCVKKYILDSIDIYIPEKWDYKWRLVIFDIPEDKKIIRDLLSRKLKEMGFKALQKSVFVFPYNCQTEINRIKFLYNVANYVQYIVAEKIETQIDLIKYFFDKKQITEEHLKEKRNN